WRGATGSRGQASPTRASGSRRLLPRGIEDAEQHEEDPKQDGDQSQRERRGGSVLTRFDGEEVRLSADDREDDAAGGEHPDVGEVGKGAGERQEHRQREERLEERYGHHPEAAPRTFRFQQGALEQLGGDRVDAGEKEYADEGAATPDVEQDDADKRPGSSAEGPVDHVFQVS